MRKLFGINTKVLLLCAASFAAVGTYALLKKPVQGVPFFTPAATIAKNFTPGTSVSYELVSAGGHVQTGQSIADNKGEVKLPALDLSAANASDLTYNLRIEAPKEKHDADPVDVSMHVDGRSGKISLKGTGWEQFAAVNVKNGDRSLDIKTDWAGMFTSDNAADLRDFKAAPVKIAFQGMNLSHDMSPFKQDPIIEVQALAPQGRGGECRNTSDGKNCLDVNRYIPTGPTTLSTWDKPQVDARIEDTKKNFNVAIEKMGAEISTSMMQDAQIMGSFMDARTNLRLQRRFEQGQAQAHATYKPDDKNMCRFGTFVRSIAATQEQEKRNSEAMNGALMDRYLNVSGTSAGQGYDADVAANASQYDKDYCNKRNSGMEARCKTNGQRPDRDIDFTGTLQTPLTLKVDFTDAASTSDENDVMTLAKNLYWPRTLPTIPTSEIEGQGDRYLQMRALIATTNLAQTSFTNMVAARSQSKGTGTDNGGAYMKSMMREFGMQDNEISELLGDNPSYYAQMEVLTKKIYQSPNFYTNLYTTPANVQRISTSMDAILLMHSRDRFEGALRTEMLASQLLEQALKQGQASLDARTLRDMRNVQQ